MRKNYFPQLPIALTANLARCSVWKEANISDEANDENHQNKTDKMKVKEEEAGISSSPQAPRWNTSIGLVKNPASSS